MASIISAIGSIVTGGMTWLGSAVTAVTNEGNELLLFSCVVGFIGTGIGLMKRIVG